MLKTIKINLPLFKTKNKTAKRKTTPVDLSQLKEKLQNNIQNRKIKNTSAVSIDNSNQITPQNEFTNSIQFMDKKISTGPSSKLNGTMKSYLPNNQKKSHTTFENIIENPDMKISVVNNSNQLSSKIYDDMTIPGCLKGGKKKTYKAFINKPISKNQRVSFTPNITSSSVSSIPSDIINKSLSIQSHPENQPVFSLSDKNTNVSSWVSQIEPVTAITPVVINTNIPIFKKDEIIDLTDSVMHPINNVVVAPINKDTKEIKLIDLPDTYSEKTPTPITTPSEPAVVIPNTNTIINLDDITIHTNVPSEPAVLEKPTIIPNTDQHISNEQQIHKIIKKTIKKYKLGKNGTRKIISVLCKNKDNIQNIKKYTQEIGSTNLNQMKQYLINNTLLSVGSYAPDDVIKQMYLNAKLAGDIMNHNDNMLVNNYITDSDHI